MNEKKQHEKDVLAKGGEPWIGVDLDGTLAEYHKWGDPIGKPINKMLERIYRWKAAGKKIKIFTARVSDNHHRKGKHSDTTKEKQIALIKEWLEPLGLEDLEITNVKDLWMTELWDDKAIQVDINTGERSDGKWQRD
jgi:hypothetical protein